MKHYRWDFGITLLTIAAVFFGMGPAYLVPLLILSFLEVSFSVDNAVVNAGVLARMSPFWQRMFLTVGIFIAVFVVRFLFPILIVVFTTDLGFTEVMHLALYEPEVYSENLEAAHDQIAMLGGVYLLMISLVYFFDEREVTWLGPIERLLAKAGKKDIFAFIVAAAIVLAIGYSVPSEDRSTILTTGLISLGAFACVYVLSNLIEQKDEEMEEETKAATSHGTTVLGATGWAGFVLFMYLEVQDAVFSFDGVSGAFAVSNSPVIIMAGLGIGALYVRSMSVHFLRTGQLAKLRYLEHGAHWAIGALATCLLLSVFFEISEYFTGLIGVFFIVLAGVHSVLANRRDAKNAPIDTTSPNPPTISDLVA